MKTMNRRQAMSILEPSLFCSTAPSCPYMLRKSSARKLQRNIDWSKELCDSEMQRVPDPRKLGKWGYAISLYLYGQFLVYKRTREKEYLDHRRVGPCASSSSPPRSFPLSIGSPDGAVSNVALATGGRAQVSEVVKELFLRTDLLGRPSAIPNQKFE